MYMPKAVGMIMNVLLYFASEMPREGNAHFTAVGVEVGVEGMQLLCQHPQPPAITQNRGNINDLADEGAAWSQGQWCPPHVSLPH
jgi:hypothetical protein